MSQHTSHVAEMCPWILLVLGVISNCQSSDTTSQVISCYIIWTPFFGGWGQCFQVPVTLYVGDSRKENCPRPIAASFPVERELPNSTYGRVGFLDPQFPKFRTEMVRSDGTDFNFGDGRLSGSGRRLDVSNYLHPAGFPRQSRCSCQEEA